MKGLLFIAISLVFSFAANAQLPFIESQRSHSRVATAMRLKEDTLRRQFAAAGLQWPVKQMYIRSFKYDSQLEVWVRNNSKEPYKLFKTYKVCAMAGSLGPKRMEGDYQVPEGFYYINEFKPNSSYHLSLGLNYPNASDRILSDSEKPGGEIYIHGNCITVGCIPIQNNQIEELYILAAYAKTHGQDFIPVHIFPIRFNNKKSFEYLAKTSKDDIELQRFAIRIKAVFDYFEEKKKLPLISVNKKGEYIVM
jgi:murein L,D-transpeptidase YafK